jgi:hypothetical protein
MSESTSTAVVVGTAALAAFATWWLASDDGVAGAGFERFEATVDPASNDGSRACVTPVDRAVEERFGGAVCGPVFEAPGLRTTAGQRVQVEWYWNQLPDGESVDALTLSPSNP